MIICVYLFIFIILLLLMSRKNGYNRLFTPTHTMMLPKVVYYKMSKYKKLFVVVKFNLLFFLFSVLSHLKKIDIYQDKIKKFISNKFFKTYKIAYWTNLMLFLTCTNVLHY